MADTLITSVGLFWRRDHVFWGIPNNAGSLLGVDAENKTAKVVNFRSQVGIYVLYADYKPVYVGQSGKGNQRLFIRLKQHTIDDLAERWDRFSWFGLLRAKAGGQLSMDVSAVHPKLDTMLNHLEGVLIHAMEPPLNGQDGRFGDKVTRYLQIRDARLGPSTHELIELLCQEEDIDLKSLKQCPP